MVDSEPKKLRGADAKLSVMRTEDVHSDQQREREVLDDDYRMFDLDAGESERGVDVPTNSYAGTSDADDVRR